MITVSLVGKKFSCSINLQILPESEGGGFELSLNAGEKCSPRSKAVSQITASLNITTQSGCANRVTKCREMLTFLQEQAIPKTMNVMKVHMVSTESQRDGLKLFNCIRPGKREREHGRDRSSSRDRLGSTYRGYVSDSEHHSKYQVRSRSTDSFTSCTDSISSATPGTPNLIKHQLQKAGLLRESKTRRSRIPSLERVRSSVSSVESSEIRKESELDFVIGRETRNSKRKVHQNRSSGRETLTLSQKSEKRYKDKQGKYETQYEHAREGKVIYRRSKSLMDIPINDVRGRTLQLKSQPNLSIVNYKDSSAKDLLPESSSSEGGTDCTVAGNLDSLRAFARRITRAVINSAIKIHMDRFLMETSSLSSSDSNHCSHAENVDSTEKNWNSNGCSEMVSRDVNAASIHCCSVEGCDSSTTEEPESLSISVATQTERQERSLKESRSLSESGIVKGDDSADWEGSAGRSEEQCKPIVLTDESKNKQASKSHRYVISDRVSEWAANYTQDGKSSNHFWFVSMSDAKPTHAGEHIDSSSRLPLDANYTRPRSSLYRRSISEQNERRRWEAAEQLSGSPCESSNSSSTMSRKDFRKARCVSCPVVSEEDIVLEGLESHHRDVCSSLSRRSQAVMRVQEIWRDRGPIRALTSCMELAGMGDTVDVLATGGVVSMCNCSPETGNKDNALFLNIVQQLPASSASWSLGMCLLLLPKLRAFISKREQCSHVCMACNILHAIIKKIRDTLLDTRPGHGRKTERCAVMIGCISELKKLEHQTDDVILSLLHSKPRPAVPEDLAILRSVLSELLDALRSIHSI